jgi:hypothetical protein
MAYSKQILQIKTGTGAKRKETDVPFINRLANNDEGTVWGGEETLVTYLNILN